MCTSGGKTTSLEGSTHTHFHARQTLTSHLWLQDTATTCRERCGGQGYLSVNRFGQILGFAHAGMTAEGDNRVLFQKVAKEYSATVTQPAVAQRMAAGSQPVDLSGTCNCRAAPSAGVRAHWLSEDGRVVSGSWVCAVAQRMAADLSGAFWILMHAGWQALGCRCGAERASKGDRVTLAG